MTGTKTAKNSESPLDVTIDALKHRRKLYHPTPNGGTGGDNAVFGYATADNVTAWSYPCHRQLNRAPVGKTLAVYSVNCPAVESVLPPNIFKDSFDWMTGPDSPWRSLLATEGKAEHTTHDFRFNYGFVFSNLKNMPANLLMNFLVATRMPKEWPEATKAWHRLYTNYNIDKALAYMFVRLFIGSGANVEGDGICFSNGNDKFAPGNPASDNLKFRFAPTEFYDWPLDHAGASEEYVRNFVRGEPNNLEGPFGFTSSDASISGGSAYGRINTCWGPTDLPVLGKGTYAQFLFDKYSDKIGTFVTSNAKFAKVTSDKSPANWAVSLSEMVSIMQHEHKRIMKSNASHSKKAA